MSRALQYSSLVLFSLFKVVASLDLSLGSSINEIAGRAVNVDWSPCTAASQTIVCGTFDVPLDWANAASGGLSLAIVKFPATKAPKLGTVFTNPGGPGGSGVDHIINGAGERFNRMTGGQYDIISWDPRGVKRSPPNLECFDSMEELEAIQDEVKARAPAGGIETTGKFSDPAVVQAFLDTEAAWDYWFNAIGEACYKKIGDNLKYVGTAATVRDMVAMAEYFDGPGKPINMYGMSYGTVIGSYFVNMFPDRVGHVVLDGVVDATDWTERPSYLAMGKSKQDSDEALEGMALACSLAGPENCELAEEGSTQESIVAYIDEMISKAYEIYKSNKDGEYHPSAIRNIVFRKMYTPRSWEELAADLVAVDDEMESILTGGTTNYTALTDAYAKRSLPMESSARLMTRQTNTIGIFNSDLFAITCADSADAAGVTTKMVLEEAVRVTEEVTPRFALNIPGTGGFYCHKWPVRAVERFQGPWNHNLANPILVIGNEADPITPYDSAVVMADLLGDDAILIEQDDFGHISTALRSECTIKAIQTYFVSGDLPDTDIFCSIDEEIFPGVKASSIRTAMAENQANDEADSVDEEVDDIQSQVNILRILTGILGGVIGVLLCSLIFIWIRHRKNSKKYSRLDQRSASKFDGESVHYSEEYKSGAGYSDPYDPVHTEARSSVSSIRPLNLKVKVSP